MFMTQWSEGISSSPRERCSKDDRRKAMVKRYSLLLLKTLFSKRERENSKPIRKM